MPSDPLYAAAVVPGGPLSPSTHPPSVLVNRMKRHPASVLLLAGLAACAGNPHHQGGTTEGGACVLPPAEVTSTALEASVDAAIPRVREVLAASLTAGEKAERIRDELPNLQAVQVLEFRMCAAHRDHAVDAAGQEVFTSQVLPLIKTTATASYFEEREKAEAYALGFIIGRLNGYYGENASYPASLADLGVQNRIETIGPNRIEYRVDSSRGFVLRSAGPDRRLGTDDDQVHHGNPN